MEKYIEILKHTKLFSGVRDEEILLMLNCLGAVKAFYRKGEYVFRQGDANTSLALLLEGSVQIQSIDWWGNRSIVSIISPGDVFAEAYALSERQTMLNDVVASAESTLLFLDAGKVLSSCPSACPFHMAVTHNLFSILADKNILLVRKADIMSKRSAREKVLSYLSGEAKRHGKSTFQIPFDRQQMADYLSLDRSALSSVLSKMKEEGLIDFRKNTFTLINSH